MITSRTPLRVTAVAAVAFLALAVVGCGQHPNVSEEPVPGALALGGLQIDEEGNLVDEEGNLYDAKTGELIGEGGGSGGLAGSGGSGGGSGGSGGGSGGGTGGGGGSGGGGGGGGAAPGGGNATGVTATTIKIGIHAPITGAAPVPAPSFEKGKDLYFEYLRSQRKPINGRHVTVVSRNDGYNPSQAVSVCKEMVEDEKVFLLFGVAGTDQLQACARYAATVGVPYLSGGVTEIGVDNLRNYFALWLSYKQQGPLLADLLVDRLGARRERNGMIRFNSPTFQDAHDGFFAGMNSRGARVVYDKAIPKTADATYAQTVATEMNQQNIKNVYVLTSPTWFIQLANAARNQGYRPQWVGVGLSMAIDTVANAACRNQDSIHGARFLNPFPAYADSDRFDPAFRRAGGSDDIMFGLWAADKVIARMLAVPGKSLTRERFIYYLERAGTIKTGVANDVRYSPTDHFGGTTMHLLRADCNDNRWETERAFVSNF
ncbi:MAG: ABC transporter substrate-binding protein [Actinomycetota bacterium]